MIPIDYFRKKLAKYDARSVAWALRYAKALYPLLQCQEWHDRIREAIKAAEREEVKP